MLQNASRKSNFRRLFRLFILEKVKENNVFINLQKNATAARNSRKYARVKDAPRAKMKVAHVSLQSCIDGMRDCCVLVFVRERKRERRNSRESKNISSSLSLWRIDSLCVELTNKTRRVYTNIRVCLLPLGSDPMPIQEKAINNQTFNFTPGNEQSLTHLTFRAPRVPKYCELNDQNSMYILVESNFFFSLLTWELKTSNL